MKAAKTVEEISELNNLPQTALEVKGGGTLSGLLNLLGDLLDQYGDMKVFCRDMEKVVVTVEEPEDKEKYGNRFLYLSNGYFG